MIKGPLLGDSLGVGGQRGGGRAEAKRGPLQCELYLVSGGQALWAFLHPELLSQQRMWEQIRRHQGSVPAGEGGATDQKSTMTEMGRRE